MPAVLSRWHPVYGEWEGLCLRCAECGPGAEELSPCTAHAERTCQCSPGYSSELDADSTTWCANVDECAAPDGPCDDSAACTDTAGSFNCTCLPGFSGDGLSCVDNDECDGPHSPCPADATCVNTAGGFTCSCSRGYFADGAENCTPCQCNGRADTCHTDTGRCTGCQQGSAGEHCELCLTDHYGDPSTRNVSRLHASLHCLTSHPPLPERPSVEP